MSISALCTKTVVGLARASLKPAMQQLSTTMCARLLPCEALATQNFTARWINYRQDCADPGPKCSKKNLAKTPCMKKKKKPKCKKSGFKSMWENPECCLDPCPNVLPRFDELYYKPSNKAKRKYAQNWAECPERRIVRKTVCCNMKLKYPKIKRRSFKRKPKTACSYNNKDSDLMQCGKRANKKCIKVRVPRCRSARDPPKCFTVRRPSDCKKVCTPYPAYSECKKPKMRPLRPVECKCLQSFMLCEAFKYMRKRNMS